MFDFEIAQFFYNMSKLLEVFEDNKYRAKAYYRAAMAIDSYSTYITELYDKGDLRSVDAIGQSIEKQICEVIETGNLVQLRQLEDQYHIKSYELLLLHGIGDKTKKKLLVNGISTIDELSEQFHNVSSEVSFTKNDHEKINWSINKRSIEKKYLYSQAYCLGMEIIEYLEKRLALKKDAEFSISFLKSMSISNDKLASIEIGISGNITSSKVATVLKKNVRLRNVSFNNTCVTGTTEFGIPFTVSTKIDLLQNVLLDTDNPMLSIRGDLHAHTTESDGISDIRTLLNGAEELGLEYIAVTDHSKTLKMSHGLTETEVMRQISIIREINQTSSVKILAGIEVEILEDGSLDYSDDVLAQLDFVVAGIHTHIGQSALFAKSRLEKALSNPYVDILAHPTTRLLGRPGNCFSVRDGIPVPVEDIIDLCCKHNVAIEINCFPERFDFSVENIKLAAKRGTIFSIGTDSHSVSHLNCIRYGKMLAIEAGLMAEQILNSRTYGELLQYFKDKRKILPKRDYTPKDFKFYFGNNTDIMTGKYRVVGIDLTGSETKPSGWALLSGEQAMTKQVKTDEDLLKATLEAAPDIVSIDSPLTLPQGRCCTKEDCDCSKHGITRYCERMLMKFGIGVYPCLIPSMANLTNRGIKLAALFRSNGLEVIESYPGVAQDVLNIPRKRKGVEHLVTGLSSFGIKGDYVNNTVSHDELDAITSALVGYFYANDQYVGMGNEREDYLIIPRPQSDYLKRRVIIGLCGEIAAGKTTLAEYLKFKYGFETKRYSDAICKMYGIPYDRTVLQKLGAEIASDSKKQRELSRYILTDMIENKSYAIDGLRHKEDFDELSSEFGTDFIFIHVVAEYKQRYKRYNEKNQLDITEFAKIDGHGSESEIKKIAVHADKQIVNNKGYRDFFKQIENILILHSKENSEVNN